MTQTAIPIPRRFSWNTSREGRRMIFWPSLIGLIGVHLGCLLVFWVGVSPASAAVASAAFLVRGLSMTAGFHRYFAHRSFKTGRVFQFLLGFIGTSALQNGPLWWAAHHRKHHRYSDTDLDPHSPIIHNFLWSHFGWIVERKAYRKVNTNLIADLARFPELCWLDRWHLVPPASLIAMLWALGSFLADSQPGLGTSGLQMVTWGFFVSTTIQYHATFSVNSFTHIFGSQRFETNDQSRNNAAVSIFALGEGWHNNHHAFPFSERQGLMWWEFDVTHYFLKVLSWLGIVWSLQSVSKSQMAEMRRSQ